LEGKNSHLFILTLSVLAMFGLASCGWVKAEIHDLNVAEAVADATTSSVLLSCPPNFISVPERLPYTTDPFCISKYEMKILGQVDGDQVYNSAFVAEARPDGTPWVNVDRELAALECQALGFGYDLVSNDQWQTIAQNTELQKSNWTANTVGVEMMFRGHSDTFPSSALPVLNAQDPFDQTGNFTEQFPGSGREQRRTLILSNGELIWDFTGNVWEWVRDDSTSYYGFDNYFSQISQSSHPTLVNGRTTKTQFGPAGNYTGLGLTQYGGLGFAWVNWNSGAILRGGSWNEVTTAGVFATQLSSNSKNLGTDLGFRCTFLPNLSPPGIVTVGPVPPLYLQATPLFTFTDSVPSDGKTFTYSIEIRRSSDNSVIVPFTEVAGNGASGIAYSELTNFLSDGETYYANIKATNVDGIQSLTRQTPSWLAIYCPSDYVAVPARLPYTVRAFCVAKYEMKIVDQTSGAQTYSPFFVAESRPDGTPWVNISRSQSITECQALGTGYDLITNDQWQTVAQNIELQNSNWTSNSIGVEMMYRGHSDSNPNATLSVTNTNDPYNQTNNNSNQNFGNGLEQRRTHNLSNGQVIWDLAGNAWEWVKDNNTNSYGLDSFLSMISDFTHFTLVNGRTAKTQFGPTGNYLTLISIQFGGFGYAWINYTNGSIRRGGNLASTTSAGVFSTNLSSSPTLISTSLGFRCTFSPQ
jgi:hypothetical protein